MISKVIRDKVDKKAAALQAPPPLPLPPGLPSGATPAPAGLLGMAALPPGLMPGAPRLLGGRMRPAGSAALGLLHAEEHRKRMWRCCVLCVAHRTHCCHPQRSSCAAGQAGQPGMFMAAAGTPGQQPQLVLLPQALMAQQLAGGYALQQTPTGLQMVQRAAQPDGEQQQQQQRQEQPAAGEQQQQQQQLEVDDGVLMCHATGRFSTEQLALALDACRRGCGGVAKFVRMSLLAGFKVRCAAPRRRLPSPAPRLACPCKIKAQRAGNSPNNAPAPRHSLRCARRMQSRRSGSGQPRRALHFACPACISPF